MAALLLCVAFRLELRVQIAIADHDGITPVSIATQEGHSDVAAMLRVEMIGRLSETNALLKTDLP